ncbi:MAG: NADPH-dependent oxidoreductase [Bacteroidales bacterium]|nr:MAG: NADPH-dependent oxidoreductase [Bacteroidales bacterium]
MDIDRYFANRRTVRRYTTQEVAPELLTQLLEEATHAPNTGNMQLYSVIVTRSEEGKRALAPLHFNQPAATGCSVLLTFCIDINRFNLWCKEGNADAGFGNLQMLLAGAIDASLFAQQFNTLAEMHGLGCCYLGTTAYNAPEIAKVLNLPDGVVPLVSLTVGYPEGEAPLSDRLPLEAIVHDEKYRQFTPEQIREIYAGQENSGDSKRFIEENGKSTLAQVFAEVRYPRATNEAFSKTLQEYLEKGFFE